MSSPAPKRQKTLPEEPFIDTTFDHPDADFIIRVLQPSKLEKVVTERANTISTTLHPHRRPSHLPIRSSILSLTSSTLFQDIFTIPQPATIERVRGLPVIHFPDYEKPLLTLLHLLHPSPSHPVSDTLDQPLISDTLDLFNLAKKYEIFWVLAEIEKKLFFLPPATKVTPMKTETRLQIWSFALFQDTPMYALAAKTMSFFPNDFKITSLSKETRKKMGSDFLIASQDFYGAEGGGPWIFPNASGRRDGKGTEEEREEWAKKMDKTDVGRMFVECGLDTSSFVYYKGSKPNYTGRLIRAPGCWEF